MAVVPDRKSTLDISVGSGEDKYRTITAEAVDCTMKYFIAASDNIFFSWEFFFISILQNANVFISRATHIMSQEFLISTINDLMRRVVARAGVVTISVS
jgi:hypothetical protein